MPTMSENFTQIMGGQKPEDRVWKKTRGFSNRRAIWGVETCTGRQDDVSQREDSPSERGVPGREREWGGGMTGHDGAG